MTAHLAAIEPRLIDIDQLITDAAERHGVNRERLYSTLECESVGFKDVAIQSDYYHDGVRENSWGIAQFNLPTDLTTADGRMITKEIAIDPEEAIDAAAYQFAEGRASRWTCYRDLYNI